MGAKTFFVVCVASVLVQTITAQCLGNIANAALANEIALSAPYGAGLPGVPYGAGLPGALGAPYGSYGMNFAPSSGGSFVVTSSSPIAPTGIFVQSENAIEGSLSVAGALPFLGTVAFESALPTAGAGAISYGCGNGAVGIVSENVGPAGPAYGPIGPNAAVAPGRFSYGPGLAANGLAAQGLAQAALAGPGLGYNGLAAQGLGQAALAGPGLGYNGLAYGQQMY